MEYDFEMTDALMSNQIDFKDDFYREYDRYDLSPLPDPSEDGLFVPIEDMKQVLEAELAEIEQEDRLGNHEIQRLMQIMNQNDTLETNVDEKDDDRKNAIIGKV
jgi:hypothetical protein